MDALTEKYYASNAVACVERYDSASVPSLHELLRPLAAIAPRVLEIGGGSGRDAAFLVQLGCDTTYTDGCKEMVAQAVQRHPELAPKARRAAFPVSEDDDLLQAQYDMVLCAAVIMHLDDGHLERFASQLSPLITDGGYLVLSHSRGHQRNSKDRDASGRLFLERTAVVVDRVLEKYGFRALRLIDNADGLGREQISWATHVLKKTA